MRIAFFTETFLPKIDGIVNTLCYLLDHLAIRGHTSLLFAPQGGYVAVVDFHNSAVPIFKRWMQVNHVRMDGHLLPALSAAFRPQQVKTHPAYGGLWEYFLFIGAITPLLRL